MKKQECLYRWRKIKLSVFVTTFQGDQFTLLPTPAAIYLFKVINGNTRALCEIYSKLLTLNTFHILIYCFHC